MRAGSAGLAVRVSAALVRTSHPEQQLRLRRVGRWAWRGHSAMDAAAERGGGGGRDEHADQLLPVAAT